jgi:hypothetical protein
MYGIEDFWTYDTDNESESNNDDNRSINSDSG